jgi:elongator complex protein 2
MLKERPAPLPALLSTACAQVHGHDFCSVAALPSGLLGRHMYASGSEEKVIRVFEAPRAFRDTLAMARGQPLPSSSDGTGSGGSGGGGGGGPRGSAPLGALLPALGLSNKAVYQEEAAAAARGASADSPAAAGGASGGGAAGVAGLAGEAAHYPVGPDMAPHSAPSAVAGPPLEEHLSQNTLWPEVHKLYGHGNDLYCLAAGEQRVDAGVWGWAGWFWVWEQLCCRRSRPHLNFVLTLPLCLPADPLGQFVASACRAQSADTATIWLWDTARWTGAAQLAAHTLTGRVWGQLIWKSGALAADTLGTCLSALPAK